MRLLSQKNVAPELKERCTKPSMQGTAAPLGYSKHVLQPTAQISGPEQSDYIKYAPMSQYAAGLGGD